MADSNGKEHNVVIANCSRECRTLPLDVGPWVHFAPNFRGVVLRVHDVFHSLYSISKAELFLLAIFAVFICRTVYVTFLLWYTYDPLYAWRLSKDLSRLGKDSEKKCLKSWGKLEVFSLKFQNPTLSSKCVSLGFSSTSTCSRHSPRNISKRPPQVLVGHGDPWAWMVFSAVFTTFVAPYPCVSLPSCCLNLAGDSTA